MVWFDLDHAAMRDYGLGAIPSPPDDRDFQLDLAALGPKALPLTWKVGPPFTIFPMSAVLNQHATGMCTPFTGTGHKLTEEKADGHALTVLPKWQGQKVAIGPEGAFDVEWLYRQAQAIDGIPLPHEGSTLRAVLHTLFKKGLAIVGHPEWAADFVIASYAKLPMTELAIKTALIQYGTPVLVAAQWPESWFSPVAGILPPPSKAIAGGHAFQVFGWSLRGPLIRNSWGPSWGTNGNAYTTWSDLLPLLHDCWKALDKLGD